MVKMDATRAESGGSALNFFAIINHPCWILLQEALYFTKIT
jgi:hypothetical protein